MNWEEKLKLYDQIVDQTDDVTRLGKTMPYTADNTHMFSLLNKEGQLGIRMGKEDRLAFHESISDDVYKSHGSVVRDYVSIPEELLTDIKKCATWLKQGHLHVLSLKANPRKKK